MRPCPCPCPNKVESNVTCSSVSRAVEAREREMANTRLDVETTTCSSPRRPPSADGDHSASYLQVVVEKHGRGGAGDGGLPPARLPSASSPLRPEVGGGAPAGVEEEPWTRLEVYRFERVGAVLVARGAAAARLEARLAGAARAVRRAAGEAAGAARLAWRLPLGAALLGVRAALEAARDACSGVTAAVSDLALKPALAVAYGALVHPLLVFVGQVLGGVHDALRPACAALHEAAGAAARVLAAVRLVDVHLHHHHQRPEPPPPLSLAGPRTHH